MEYRDPRHELINKSGFNKYLPKIAANIGPHSAIFLSELLNSDSYWYKNPEKYYEKTGKPYWGRFYHSREMIEKRTGLSPSQQRKAQEALKDFEIISVISKGLPRKNYYLIDYQTLNAFLSSCSYDDEEDYSQILEQQEAEKLNDKTLENSTSRGEETAHQDVKKLHINNNKGIIKKNKNKVSNATDGAEAPKSSLNSVKQQNSCIKDDIGGSPPGAHAQNRATEPINQPTNSEVDRLIQKYNAAMGIEWNYGDRKSVAKNLSRIQAVEKYFTPIALSYAWKNMGDKACRELKDKRISGFIGYFLLDEVEKRGGEIYAYCADHLDFQLDRVFRRFENYINEQVKPKGYICEGADLEPIDIKADLNTKQHRELRYQIYKQHLEPLLLAEDDFYDMMITLEAE